MPKPKKSELTVIQLVAALSARIDGWALVRGVERSEAILHLIELGLEAKIKPKRISLEDAIAIEDLVARQLDRLIDPETPQEERDRRIHRLTDGPPEFVGLRIDLPGRRPH